ncbi:alpha/beta hydrolase [Chloroflexota bacterium]
MNIEIVPVTFSSCGRRPVELEGIFHICGGERPRPAAVICHPHPLGGGSMHNSVVSAVARALSATGVMALRFNFRGVGHSGGNHDNGRNEQEDVAGAVRYLLDQPSVDPGRVCVAGYSFGAWVALSFAETSPHVAAVAAVSLVSWNYDTDFHRFVSQPGAPVGTQQFDPGFLQSFARPKLLIVGEHDSFAPPKQLRALTDQIPEPRALHIVPNTDHFLRGCEQEVGNRVAEFLAGV